LCLLNARTAEHQLGDPNVDAVGQQAAGAFVTKIDVWTVQDLDQPRSDPLSRLAIGALTLMV
jgi:hypothetical protein